MVSPAIALRFRDTTPDVDTIQSHLEILKREGAVWWGWWKKGFEDDHIDFFKSLPEGHELNVLILDRSTQRMFQATSVAQQVGEGAKPDLELVPSYYRGNSHKIFGWFLLTSLEQIDYIDGIGERFGDSSLVDLSNTLAQPVLAVGEDSSRSKKSSILHLSDLHFGAHYGFLTQNSKPEIGDPRGTLTDCILADLARLGVDGDICAILVTGDFTSNGDWSDKLVGDVVNELQALQKALGVEATHIIALPGNHDVERYPEGVQINIAEISVGNQSTYRHEDRFRLFIDRLTGRSWKEPLDYIQRIKLAEADVLVAALNSCRILATKWTEYGYVGPTGLDIIKALGNEPVEVPTFRLMALHHHLLPVTDVETPNEKGVTLSLDAAKLLDMAQEARVHLAVHGHQHVPRLSRYQTVPLMGGTLNAPMTIISNGSTGVSADRRPAGERNTYCVFSFTKNQVLLRMRELRPDKRSGAELYSGPLEMDPALPA
jgi:predicted phosphodiesterase